MKAYVINLQSRTDKLINFYKNDLPFKVQRFNAIIDSPGDNGCAKSHLSIIATQKEFPFVIFEDDCVMLQPWSEVEKAMSQLPDNWDALWLGATLTHPLKRYSDNLFRLRRAYTTHAIIYNSARITDYILKNFRVKKTKSIIDLFYFSDVQDRFNCFITYPLIATQSEGISDVAKKETDSWIIEESYNKYTR